MKKLLTLIIIGLFTVNANSQQIKLDINSFPDTFTWHTYYIIYNPAQQIQDSLNIGTGDTGEMYDFDELMGLQTNGQQQIRYISTSKTPYAANHPTANLAYMADFEVDGSDTTFVRWNFVKVDSAQAAVVGVTFEIDTAAYFFGNLPKGRQVAVHSTYDSAEVFLDTSYQRGYANTTVSHSSVTIDTIKHDETTIRSMGVDGYGTLDHPRLMYSNPPVLRVKVRLEKYTRDTFNGVEESSSRDTAYYLQYISQNFGPIITVQTNSTYTSIERISYLSLAEVPPSTRNNIPELSFNLYPNPASGSVNIAFDEVLKENYTIKIYNTLGQVVTTQSINKGDKSITMDVSTLPKGTYYVSVENDKGERALTKKLMIN